MEATPSLWLPRSSADGIESDASKETKHANVGALPSLPHLKPRDEPAEEADSIDSRPSASCVAIGMQAARKRWLWLSGLRS